MKRCALKGGDGMKEDLEIQLQALLAEAKEVANGFVALRDRAMKLEITFSDGRHG